MENHVQFTFPCSKKWEDLNDLSNGKRFCESCNKCITDFSGLNSMELNTHFKALGNACGKFSIDQLPGLYSRYSLINFTNISLSILSLLGVFAPVNGNAQTDADINNLYSNLTSTNDTLKFPIQVHGRLRDKGTLEVAIGVKVQVIQNDTVIKTTTTDFNGRFSFSLTDKELTDSLITLRVSYNFLSEKTTDLTLVNDSNLSSAEFDMLLTGIPSLYLISSPPLPGEMHKRRHFNVLGRAAISIKGESPNWDW
ncbi:MAG TPA: carboxypeptidase-like regulatory domain-containing protein [Bacteroidia bacterium]|nr:carboxypeptidase-like regulatory domain-containing protein [Bacteroidia bacterium]